MFECVDRNIFHQMRTIHSNFSDLIPMCNFYPGKLPIKDNSIKIKGESRKLVKGMMKPPLLTIWKFSIRIYLTFQIAFARERERENVSGEVSFIKKFYSNIFILNRTVQGGPFSEHQHFIVTLAKSLLPTFSIEQVTDHRSPTITEPLEIKISWRSPPLLCCWAGLQHWHWIGNDVSNCVSTFSAH